VLEDWKVLAIGVGEDFLALFGLRSRSVHLSPETYSTMRGDTLSALRTLGKVISGQFGYFGRQPWFTENTPGAQFIKREWEDGPFVRAYIIPRSGFVGPGYGMDHSPNGLWQHLDYDDYGDRMIEDDQFVKAHRERDPNMVVTHEMLERIRQV